MRRIRATFVLLAVLLLAPLSLLLFRALQGIERERDARHELVASRVFDEAERALGEFLRDEQQRPAEHYRIDGGDGGVSPLASTPPPEFVIGYFEIDREGRVSTPSARNPAALVAELREALPQLSSGVAGFAREGRAVAPAPGAPGPPSEQAPGTTRILQKVDPLMGTEALDARVFAPRAEGPAREAAESDLSSYRVLERLNLAARKRASADAPAGAAEASQPQATAPALPPSSGIRADPLDPRLLAARLRDESIAQASTAERRAPAPDAVPGAPGRVAPEPSRAVALRTPLEGIALGPARLVLHRTALRGDEGAFEQGLLVDLPRLAGWLESGVLGASGLRRHLELDFPFVGDAPAPLAAGRFVFEHRFQEPFAALRARLSVAPLPDQGSAAYLYALGALLVVASTAGLWAVYRRVAAAVHFSERRSNFAAAVSHELKTPLTAIRMYAEMLRDDMVRDEPTRRSYLDTITSESERLTRLINNVLEFSRLERRTQALVLRSETPLPALREALRTLGPHARAQGFELREASVEPLPAVIHDRDALQQILFNLIDNALKYARRAERKVIEVACAPCSDGVAVRVRDFGPGVAREHQAHLFEPFYRAGDELTRQAQGTGIGLALVRELAQRMGAEVSARNCADGGFAVELRLRGA